MVVRDLGLGKNLCIRAARPKTLYVNQFIKNKETRKQPSTKTREIYPVL